MIKITNNSAIFVYSRYNFTVRIADMRGQEQVNIYIFYTINREKEVILDILFGHHEWAVFDIKIKHFRWKCYDKSDFVIKNTL